MMHRIEGLPTALIEDADQIHHDIGAPQGCRNRCFIANVGGYRNDLADIAHRLAGKRFFGPAADNTNLSAASRQRLDDIASDKP
jgi:hypothetical protein